VSILSDFEDRVGRAIEGVFAGVFRAPVQPAELARAAAKEMDRRRRLGVGKVYAPTLYSILLSPADGDQLGGFSKTLAGELETYLAGYAAERDYDLACRPRVRFLVDEELKLGRFEVIGELLSAEDVAAEMGDEDDAPAPGPAPSPLPVSASAPETPTFAPTGVIQPLPERAPELALATVTVPGIGHDIVLTGDRMVVGRLADCAIRLEDANVSREHAAFVRDGAGWAIEDLGSTNGTLVNGEQVAQAHLSDGDVVSVGITELIYHEPRG